MQQKVRRARVVGEPVRQNLVLVEKAFIVYAEKSMVREEKKVRHRKPAVAAAVQNLRENHETETQPKV